MKFYVCDVCEEKFKVLVVKETSEKNGHINRTTHCPHCNSQFISKLG